MHTIIRSVVRLAACLVSIHSVVAIPTVTPRVAAYATAPTPAPTIPASCYTTWDDWEHTTAGVSGPSCYTFTETAPVPCPLCPSQTNPRACPALIKLTTLEVPCSTDCCPTTSTSYLPGTCPPCGQCVIPTYTSTVTTGCPDYGGYRAI